MRLKLIRRIFSLLGTNEDPRFWEPTYKFILLKMKVDLHSPEGVKLLRTFDPAAQRPWGFIMVDMSEEDLIDLLVIVSRNSICG